MSWIVLVVSGVFEAVWATALGKSEGFSRFGPTVLFGVALVASMAGLAYAMRGAARRNGVRGVGGDRGGIDRRLLHGHRRGLRQCGQAGATGWDRGVRDRVEAGRVGAISGAPA